MLHSYARLISKFIVSTFFRFCFPVSSACLLSSAKLFIGTSNAKLSLAGFLFLRGFLSGEMGEKIDIHHMVPQVLEHKRVKRAA